MTQFEIDVCNEIAGNAISDQYAKKQVLDRNTQKTSRLRIEKCS